MFVFIGFKKFAASSRRRVSTEQHRDLCCCVPECGEKNDATVQGTAPLRIRKVYRKNVMLAT